MATRKITGRKSKYEETTFSVKCCIGDTGTGGYRYVLYNHGCVNAGYAVVPMVLVLAVMALSRKLKDGE